MNTVKDNIIKFASVNTAGTPKKMTPIPDDVVMYFSDEDIIATSSFVTDLLKAISFIGLADDQNDPVEVTVYEGSDESNVLSRSGVYNTSVDSELNSLYSYLGNKIDTSNPSIKLTEDYYSASITLNDLIEAGNTEGYNYYAGIDYGATGNIFAWDRDSNQFILNNKYSVP